MDQASSFFDSLGLVAHAEVMKALRSLPVSELHALLWQIRRAELAAGTITPDLQSEVRQRFLAGMERFGLPIADEEQIVQQHLHAILHETPLLSAYLLILLSNAQFLQEYVIWHGRERLEAARAEGHGAVLIQAHWGSFQLLFPMLVASGYPTLQAFGEPEAAEWTQNLFKAYGPLSEEDAQVTSVGKDPVVWHALRALKRNTFFCLPFEISMGAKPGFEASLLGRRVPVPEGPYVIAAKAGAPVMPVFVEVEGPYLHIHIVECIRVPSRSEEHVQAAIDQVYAEFSRRLAAQPYMWRGWHFLDELIGLETK